MTYSVLNFLPSFFFLLGMIDNTEPSSEWKAWQYQRWVIETLWHNSARHTAPAKPCKYILYSLHSGPPIVEKRGNSSSSFNYIHPGTMVDSSKSVTGKESRNIPTDNPGLRRIDPFLNSWPYGGTSERGRSRLLDLSSNQVQTLYQPVGPTCLP